MKNLFSHIKVALVIILLLSHTMCQSTEKKKNLQTAHPLYQTGMKLYSKHCHSCHKLKESGGDIGPSLDELSKQQDGTLIREAIVEPNREVKNGYQPNIMPLNYGKLLSENEMDALIFYLTNQY